MIRAIYSTGDDGLDLDGETVIWIGPKARAEKIRERRGKWTVFPIEDITKRDPWLWLNGAVDDGTTLVLDRVSRYYRVSSETAKRLERISTNRPQVYLTDIVPFCEDVQYLYMPWRYIDRSILGYAHYYAFRENYAEVREDGAVVQAHDFDFLAEKIAPHVSVGRRGALVSDRKTVVARSSSDERAEYRALRKHLFEKYRTPQPIITRLADLTHGFETRRECAMGLIERRIRHGRVCVVTNLASYGKRMIAGLGRSAVAGTYSKPHREAYDCDALVYAEPPIVQTFRIFDVEAAIRPDCRVVRVRGDNKVDEFLEGRVASETGCVERFMRTLASHAGLSTDERAGRGHRALAESFS